MTDPGDVRLAAELTAMRPERSSARSPIVSIVVTNRDGEHHLSRLLQSLRKRTHYRNVQLVLVDNGSSDRSKDVARQWSGDLVLIENTSNQSFSHANNQGIAAASGELVLLANNDIDPINPDWLGHMVDALEDGASAVGAMLVYPTRAPRADPPDHPDHTVQHLGIGFLRAREEVRAINLGAGQDPLAITTLTTREVAGVTAACMLARRLDLLTVGGFDESYFYGSEDWDLSLRLGALGPVVVEPKAVLFHHEYGTQERFADEERRKNQASNRRLFFEAWGPSILRRLLLERLGHAPKLLSAADRSSVRFVVDDRTPETVRRVIEAWHAEATDSGWDSAIAPGPVSRSVDLLVTGTQDVRRVDIARALLSIALPASQLATWSQSGLLDAVDLVGVTSSLAQASVDAAFVPSLAMRLDSDSDAGGDRIPAFRHGTAAAASAANTPLVGITTCVPDEAKAPFWGDTHFARGLGRGFAELGVRYRELIEPEWSSALFGACDATVHLRGIHPRRPWPGQRNALWFISHPDRRVEGECDGFDVIASASRLHAEELSRELGRNVLFLPQATDPNVFRPGPHDVDLEADVLYVGNSRWPYRRAPRWLHRAGVEFHLYGKNWDGFPEVAHRQADFFPNSRLGELYRSASIVVADHHPDMRNQGFAANRIFDVLASGGFVVSDDVVGLHELVDGAVPVYTSQDELIDLVRHYLANPAERRRLSAIGRQRVLASHTFHNRAANLLELLRAEPPALPIRFTHVDGWPTPLPPAHVPHGFSPVGV